MNTLAEQDKRVLIDFIENSFAQKSIDIGADIQIPQSLIANECFLIIESENKRQLNTASDYVLNGILQLAEKRLNKSMPIDIPKVIVFADEFQKELEQPRVNHTWVGLIELIANLKAYLLVELQHKHGLNVIDFYYSLTTRRNKARRDLSYFEKPFFLALPKLVSEANEIKKTLLHCLNTDQTPSPMLEYCREIGEKHSSLAIELLDLEDIGGKIPIIGNLLIGLYNSEPETSLQLAEQYESINPFQTIFFFGRIDYRSEEHILKAFEVAERTDSTNIELIQNTPDIYANILKSKYLTSELENRCFNNFDRLLTIENENLTNQLIWFFTVIIKGFEERRYSFLHKFLNKTQNLNLIKTYFHNFSDPRYFFHFFTIVFNQLGQHMEMEFFKKGLRHFWQVNNLETQNHLLEIVSHSNKSFRISVLRLIQHTFPNFNQINFMLLDTAEKQLRVLEGLKIFPYNIDSTIASLLQFRKSKHKQVVIELQTYLSKLILESYHDYLFELIANGISKTKKDVNLLAPIRDALELYHEIKTLKSTVNDLNPLENERDHMNLYWVAEHESKAIMMESIKEGKGTFLENFGKTSLIVRGNAWKLDERKDISPLGNYSHSIILDDKMFKNPDWYNNQLNNLNSTL